MFEVNEWIIWIEIIADICDMYSIVWVSIEEIFWFKKSLKFS